MDAEAERQWERERDLLLDKECLVVRSNDSIQDAMEVESVETVEDSNLKASMPPHVEPRRETKETSKRSCCPVFCVGVLLLSKEFSAYHLAAKEEEEDRRKSSLPLLLETHPLLELMRLLLWLRLLLL